MTKRAGAFTTAVAFIALGCAILADRMLGTGWLDTVIGYWPALLILLGLEIAWNQARSKEDQGWKLDGKMVALLIIIVVGANVYHLVQRPDILAGRFNGTADSWLGDSQSFPLKEQTVSAAEVESIRVDNPVGRTIVKGSNRSDIRLTGTIYARGDSAQEQADQVDVKLEQGKETRVKVDVPGDHSAIKFFKSNPSVELIIEVPEKLKAEIEASVASITVERVAAVKANATTGTVEISNISGDAHITTTTGKVKAALVQGQTTMKTTTGAIEAEKIGGDLNMTATTGSISFKEAAKQVHAKATTGKIDGTIDGPIGGNYFLDTTTGKLSLDLSKNSSASFTAHTGTGGIGGSLGWSGDSHDKKAVLNGGQYQVDLKATTGRVDVDIH